MDFHTFLLFLKTITGYEREGIEGKLRYRHQRLWAQRGSGILSSELIVQLPSQMWIMNFSCPHSCILLHRICPHSGHRSGVYPSSD